MALPGSAHCFPVAPRDAQMLMSVVGWAEAPAQGVGASKHRSYQNSIY